MTFDVTSLVIEADFLRKERAKLQAALEEIRDLANEPLPRAVLWQSEFDRERLKQIAALAAKALEEE